MSPCWTSLALSIKKLLFDVCHPPTRDCLRTIKLFQSIYGALSFSKEVDFFIFHRLTLMEWPKSYQQNFKRYWFIITSTKGIQAKAWQHIKNHSERLFQHSNTLATTQENVAFLQASLFRHVGPLHVHSLKSI